MPRRGENIYKRKDKRWEGRVDNGFTMDGKKKYKSLYGKSYQEVKQRMKEYSSQKAPVKQVKTILTFQDLSLKWLEKQMLDVKASTFLTYDSMLKRYILPCIGEMRLHNIKADTIQEFLLQKLETGRIDGTGGLSKKTVKDMQTMLGSIMEFGVNEYGFENPCHFIKNVKASVPDIDILTEEERKKITKHCTDNLDSKSIGILISMYTGLRLGEVCALKWHNIILDKSLIQVQYTINRVKNDDPDRKDKTKLIVDTPKSDSSKRIVPIPQFLLSHLEQLYKQNSKDCFLLTNQQEIFMNPRTYQNYFKNLLNTCGLRSMRYHCMRHGFATMCIGLGFDIKTLSEILGHSEVGMTLKRYVHSSAELKQMHMNKLSDLAI